MNTNSNKIEMRKGAEKYTEENDINILILQSKESRYILSVVNGTRNRDCLGFEHRKQNRNDWGGMGSRSQRDKEHYQMQLRGSGLLGLAVCGSLVISLRAVSVE